MKIVKQYTIEKLRKINALTKIHMDINSIEERREQNKANKNKNENKNKE